MSRSRPTRWTSTCRGTLPLRKPGIFGRLGEVRRGVLDGVVDVVRRHLDRQPDAVLGELLDLGLHLAIQADPAAWSRWPGRCALFVLTRHAHSTLNDEGRINGDPSVPVPSPPRAGPRRSDSGSSSRSSRSTCAYTPVSAGRGRRPTRILAGRDVPTTRGAAARRHRRRRPRGRRRSPSTTPGSTRTRATSRFPGGESLDDAARRYAPRLRATARADGARRCSSSATRSAIRYALNAAAGSDDLDAPEHVDPERDALPLRRDGPRAGSVAHRITRSVKQGARNRRRMRLSNR